MSRRLLVDRVAVAVAPLIADSARDRDVPGDVAELALNVALPQVRTARALDQYEGCTVVSPNGDPWKVERDSGLQVCLTSSINGTTRRLFRYFDSDAVGKPLTVVWQPKDAA